MSEIILPKEPKSIAFVGDVLIQYKVFKSWLERQDWFLPQDHVENCRSKEKCRSARFQYIFYWEDLSQESMQRFRELKIRGRESHGYVMVYEVTTELLTK